ncbi:MAG: UbiA family prenyltransferase [Candidatus Micrarchaeota archaeon]|nr:UbiA family prenyltransferase [Candidatus Micrarchaeota archaeon]
MGDGLFSKIKLIFNEVFIGMILFVVVPTAILGVVASGSISLLNVLGAVFLIAVLQITPNVLNNYVDWEIDRINKKRTEMHKRIKKSSLPIMALVLVLTTIPFFVYGNIYLRIVMVIAYFMMVNYNLLIKAKDVLFLNYAFIALYYGPLAFAVGFFFSLPNLALFESLAWMPLFIFLVNMGFSVIKDYGDVEGDKALNKMTLPVVIGEKATLAYQFILITAVFAGMIYFGVTSFGWTLSGLLIIPYAIAMYAMRLVSKPKNSSVYAKASNIIRINAFVVMAILFLYFI